MTLTSLVGLATITLLAIGALLQWLSLRRARRHAEGLSMSLRNAEANIGQLRQSIEDLTISRHSLIAALAPRRIDETQRKLLIDRLSRAPQPLSVEIRVAADQEAEEFAVQLKSALKAAGVDVLLHRVIGIGPTSSKGADTLRLLRKEHAAIIHDSLSAAGIALRMIEWPEPPTRIESSSINKPMPDAVIMLNRKTPPADALDPIYSR